MKAVLEKCQWEDFAYLSSVLDNPWAFAPDKRRRELVRQEQRTAAERAELIALLDEQIKYNGSSELGYWSRKLSKKPAGVSAVELVEDVCKKLGVKSPQVGSVESRLEKLALAVVEKELLSHSPEQLAQEFDRMGIQTEKKKLFFQKLKITGPVTLLPLVTEVLGPKVALGIVEKISVSLIAQVIGAEAAKQVMKTVLKRNPWMHMLGPAIWTLSGVWLAFDLQGPAYRKTVPICLYLGVVSLRDGEEQRLQVVAA